MVWFLGSNHSEIIFALLTKFVVFYMSFSPIDVREPSLQKSFLWVFEKCHRSRGLSFQEQRSQFLGAKALASKSRGPNFQKQKSQVLGVEVLAFRTVLRICYRLSSKYLATKDTTENTTKCSRLETEPKAKSPSSSSILLFIREKLQDVGVTECIAKSVIKA